MLRVGGAFARSDQRHPVHVLWITLTRGKVATRRRGCFSRHAEGVAHNFFHNLFTASELGLFLSPHRLSTGCPQRLRPCEQPSTGCPPVIHRTIHTLVCLLRTGPSSVAARAMVIAQRGRPELSVPRCTTRGQAPALDSSQG